MPSNLAHQGHKLFTVIALLGVLVGLVGNSTPGIASGWRQEDDLRIDVHRQTGKVNFIGADPEAAFRLSETAMDGVEAEDLPMRYLEHFGDLLGLKAPARELQVMRKRTMQGGKRTSTRYQQVYKGVPILAGELIVNLDEDGALLSISGEVSPDLDLSVEPVVTADAARGTALGATAKGYGLEVEDLEASQPELWIFDERLLLPSARPAELVWRMEVIALDVAPVEELVLVNAHTGGVSLHFNQVDTWWSMSPGDNQTFFIHLNHGDSTVQSAANGGTIWYVATNGDDESDCLSPLTACETINEAIQKALDGDTILVASGRYTSTGSRVVYINKDIHLLGGWDASFSTQEGMSLLDGEGARVVVGISTSAEASMARFEIIHGWSDGEGGGIQIYLGTITLSECNIHDNYASTNGGGIKKETGSLTIQNSAIYDNEAVDQGGGIYIRGNGPVVLSSSAVTGNSALSGAGIYNWTGELTISNSTISGNVSFSGRSRGAGIGNIGSSSELRLLNTTVSHNYASQAGGIYSNATEVFLQNSIIAGNIGFQTNVECYGIFTSQGYNLIGDTSGCTYNASTGDLVGVDPLLGPLVGSPGYHPLTASSPAVDAGNPTGCVDDLGAPLDVDQRGAPRAGVCDIGAYEHHPSGSQESIHPVSGTPQRMPPSFMFERSLQAAVLDSIGSPVQGVSVTFTAPATGPSGTFAASGTETTTVITDEFGVATASTFTGNEAVGSYLVEAAFGGVGNPAEFELTNRGLYVTLDGEDANDCLYPSTPCASIQAAIEKAVPTDTILITEGTYYGSDSYVFVVDRDVRILGGWNVSFSDQTGLSVVDGEHVRGLMHIEKKRTMRAERLILTHGNAWSPIYNQGILQLVDCQITENQDRGIYNTGRLSLLRCAVARNQGLSNGGGIYNEGTLVVRNSTVSANTTNHDAAGIDTSSGGPTLIQNSTITNNISRMAAGGLRTFDPSNVVMQNSILALNRGPLSEHDCRGEIQSLGYNLIGEVTPYCNLVPAEGDLSNVAPNLSPLGDHGGLTPTNGFYPGSLGIDAGNPSPPGSSDDACEVDDQRGVTRPIDGDGVDGSRCDMGAYELDPASIPALPPGERSTYSSFHTTTLPGYFFCDESEPNCSYGYDEHADAAHEHASDTYAFYLDRHGRDSIDNAGMRIVSTVRFSSLYDNAFWSSSYQQVVYGDAHDLPYADDVVAHELTHGVTEYESNLFYYYQSGAINESFSDLWGEFVDQTNGTGFDHLDVKWIIAEKLPSWLQRNMMDPPDLDAPDRITSPLYYLGEDDNGGVHTNSGVNNKAVYLLTEGGSFNGYTITGLGLDKVAALYYEVQTGLLTSGSDYKDLYNALYQACLNLSGGAQGITIADCVEVREATNAVEMQMEPVPGFNPEASLCESGRVPEFLFVDDFETPGTSWNYGALKGTSSWSRTWGYATSGEYMIWGDDSNYNSDSFARFSWWVTLPPDQTSYLHFNHAFGFEDPDLDGGFLEYFVDGGEVYQDAGPLIEDGLAYTGSISVDGTNRNKGHPAYISDSHGYVSTRLNLSPLAGERVLFRWRVSTDGSGYDLGWVVDDVRVYTCQVRRRAPADFTANDTSDIVVFRGGAWRFFDYDTAVFDHGVWTGTTPGCIPAPMDYDGDGGVEFTQLCDGAWHFYDDAGAYVKGIWTGGVAGELPVPADYDGDGVDDVVVWRAGAWRFFDYDTAAFDHGVWTGSPPHWLGGTNIPVPMDYDGDGMLEFTVFSGGPWHFYNDDGSYNKGIWTGGAAGDLPVPADYDGDGTEEVVVWREGAWRFFDFATGVFEHGVWTGAPPHWLGGTSLPAPLDVDGDGSVDFTVFSGGPWHFYNDDGSYAKGIWTGGVAGDQPISRRLLP